jgi:hypothetical protein
MDGGQPIRFALNVAASFFFQKMGYNCNCFVISLFLANLDTYHIYL